MQKERDTISRKSHNSLYPWGCQGFMLRLGVLVMAVLKCIFSVLDCTVAAATSELPNNVAATALPWVSKKKLNSQPTCIGEKPLAPHFPKGNPSATRMLYPSLIIMSITLELRTQRHHHYNPFKDELSTCICRPEQEAAFCSQLQRCYPQPENSLEHPCPVSQLHPTPCCMVTQELNTSYSSHTRMHLGQPLLQSSSQLSQLRRLLFFL